MAGLTAGAGNLSAHDQGARLPSPIPARRSNFDRHDCVFFQPRFAQGVLDVALALTAAAILLHFFSLTQVGGLWRDEIAIANIARLPSWAETFRALPHDHCPIVFPAVVRVWTALGWAQTDAGLRVLGLGIGLFLLASFGRPAG